MDAAVSNIVIAVLSSLTTLLTLFLTNYFKNKKSNINSLSEHRIQRDVVIYEIINSLKNKFKFSRVLIILFHNGSKYYNGESIQKASVVYETIEPGVTPTGTTMRDIPVTTMTSSLKELSKTGKYLVWNVDDISDEHYRNLMKSYKETKHFSFKLEDETGWIGVLTCDYTTDSLASATSATSCFDSTCVDYIEVQAKRLSLLLKLTNKTYGLPNRG
jgi:hypothetical protein